MHGQILLIDLFYRFVTQNQDSWLKESIRNFIEHLQTKHILYNMIILHFTLCQFWEPFFAYCFPTFAAIFSCTSLNSAFSFYCLHFYLLSFISSCNFHFYYIFLLFFFILSLSQFLYLYSLSGFDILSIYSFFLHSISNKCLRHFAFPSFSFPFILSCFIHLHGFLSFSFLFQ